jgi:predicted PurR-regulated permease PerM
MNPSSDSANPSHDKPSLDTERDTVWNIALDIALRLTLVGTLVVTCWLIVSPFLSILLWAGILAVALATPFEAVVSIVKRRGGAATLISVVTIGLIVLPAWTMGESLIDRAHSLQVSMSEGALKVPPPPQFLIDLPRIGDRLVEAWPLASGDVQQAVAQFEPQIRTVGRWSIGFLTGIGGAVLQTIVSLLVAMACLTYRDSLVKTVRTIAQRIDRSSGDEYVDLAAATINSVTLGVIGVAVFQAAAAGLVMMLGGFEAVGIVVVIVLIVAVIQLPVNMILLWPIAWGFSEMSTPGAIAFMVALLLVGFADAPLKPLLLGRGVPVPTLVILIGALGGMVAFGMIGLFLGAVLLSIGYRLLLAWSEMEPRTTA